MSQNQQALLLANMLAKPPLKPILYMFEGCTDVAEPQEQTACYTCPRRP